MKRQNIVAIAIILVTTAAASVAMAWSCVARASQQARLELVSVTVDGVAQTDLHAYAGLEVSVQAPYTGGRTSPPGAQFIAKAAGARYDYLESFDVPANRDR